MEVGNKGRSIPWKKIAGTSSTEGWMGPRTYLGACGKSRSHQNQFPGPPGLSLATFILYHILIRSGEFAASVRIFEDGCDKFKFN